MSFSSYMKGAAASTPATETATAGGGGGGLMSKIGGMFGTNSGTDLPMVVESSVAGPSMLDGVVPEMSRGDRLKGFIMLILASAFFFVLSSLFFPAIVLMPSKFAMSFTMGSVLFMVAFAVLRGPKEHFKTLCSKARIPFTLAYVLSLAGTVWACLFLKMTGRYFVILGFAGVQIVALLWFGATYIPGGKTGMKFMSMMFMRTIKLFCAPCMKVRWRWRWRWW